MHLKRAVIAVFVCLFSVACTQAETKAADQAVSTPVKAAPLGNYVCYQVNMNWNGTWTREHKGLLKLISADSYQYQNGGKTESYVFDPGSQKLKFNTGFFQDATGTLIDRGRVWQINVKFATKTPLTWNCGQNKSQ